MIDLAQAMGDALQFELKNRSSFSEQGNYIINVNILKYEPGNAFKRWLMPGAGETKLAANAFVTIYCLRWCLYNRRMGICF
ncbi:DUF4410 domain-containing protein [Candidatus Desulfovibrio trichonymphae]|uniref:DUF4410 domain-containing protein n=1 Tax=Candidatus Desulfovibrio trichonymphae TaxID=1725232 RepID=UPI000BBA93C3